MTSSMLVAVHRDVPQSLLSRSALIVVFGLVCGLVFNATALGQSGPQSGMIAVRGQHDFNLLFATEQAAVIPAPPGQSAAQRDSKHKIPAKYDVSRIGERRVDRGLDLYSIAQEQAIGKRMAEKIERECRLVKDPVVTQYVEDLGQRLVRNSDAKIPFTIKVIDNDEVNAFALPGGYLYVNSGLILAAHNESELAAVMSHEIAHVAARHATRNMTKAELWNIASMPLMFFGGPIGMTLRQVSGFAYPMTVLKFSRDAEREADLLGIEYAYAAGYDPASFVNFFERLKANKFRKNFIAKTFATHPMNHDRIERAQKEIATMLPPRDEYIVDTSGFRNAQERLLEDSGEALVLHRGRTHNGGPILHRRTMDKIPSLPGKANISDN
ncbi:MAG TPA: M48 family metallopeptidase [Candidatus Angelobacter sp.]|nr:M48 family metallopeptidase [Candidatus Angelobacter sp.]